MPDNEISFTIPNDPFLQKLTMRQIKDAINAKQFYGDEDSLSYDVGDFKIGAMNIENVLQKVSAGTLVIVPGDRLDVLMGLTLTLLSDNFPKIAGILLTCVKPQDQFKELIYGLKKLPVAILSVESDTFVAAANINNVRPILLPQNEQRLATALGLFEKYVNTEELAKKIAIAKSNVVTPLMFEYELFNRAKQNRKHIVLPEGNDDRVLRAASILLKEM